MSALVIGAGLAGVVAATRLADRGVAVQVVADRPGATALHGGGWYLGLQQLARLGLPTPRIGEALAFVGEGLVDLDLLDGPFALLDTDGARRVVDLAPATHAAAAAFDGPVALIDLTGLGHPFAAMLRAAFGDRPTEVVEVPFPDEAAIFDRSFAALAALLDAPDAQARLRDALTRALTGRAVCGVLLPPVLGVTTAAAQRQALTEALGLPVAEALGTLPSTPGLRLHRALEGWLARCGVPVRRGRVERIEPAEGRVWLDGEAVRAEVIVMATGGPLPGGLASDGRVHEPLAGLRLSPALPHDLLSAVNPTRPYGEALFRTGVAVDAQFRPTRHDGDPVARGLFAAGDLLGGPDGVSDACGSGLALLTGFLVAEHAAAMLGGGA